MKAYQTGDLTDNRGTVQGMSCLHGTTPPCELCATDPVGEKAKFLAECERRANYWNSRAQKREEELGARPGSFETTITVVAIILTVLLADAFWSLTSQMTEPAYMWMARFNAFLISGAAGFGVGFYLTRKAKAQGDKWDEQTAQVDSYRELAKTCRQSAKRLTPLPGETQTTSE
jgi:hypothetical protein